MYIFYFQASNRDIGVLMLHRYCVCTHVVHVHVCTHTCNYVCTMYINICHVCVTHIHSTYLFIVHVCSMYVYVCEAVM
jgi:hypothetical protein